MEANSFTEEFNLEVNGVVLEASDTDAEGIGQMHALSDEYKASVAKVSRASNKAALAHRTKQLHCSLEGL